MHYLLIQNTTRTYREEAETGEDDAGDEHGEGRHRQDAPERALVVGLLPDLLFVVLELVGLDDGGREPTQAHKPTHANTNPRHKNAPP